MILTREMSIFKDRDGALCVSDSDERCEPLRIITSRITMVPVFTVHQ